MQFKTIPGHAALKETLIQAVKNQRVAHAQLFAGKEGSGALAMALAYAQYLICENKQNTDSCGVCPACSKASKLIHPDIHYVFPVTSNKEFEEKNKPDSDMYMKYFRAFVLETPFGRLVDWSQKAGYEKLPNIKVEEGRKMIGKLAYKAFEASHKIMMIWLPELMNGQAANSILKVLEEPPDHTVFLMVSEDSSRLLPTIISRTQRVDVPLFEPEELKAYLKSLDEDADEAALNQAVHLADGNIVEAMRQMEHTTETYDTFLIDWLRLCYSFAGKILDLQAYMEAFIKKGRDQQRGFFVYAISKVRDSLMANQKANAILKLNEDQAVFAQNFGKLMVPEAAAQIIRIFEDAAYHIERNASGKIIFMDVSLQVGMVFHKIQKRKAATR